MLALGRAHKDDLALAGLFSSETCRTATLRLQPRFAVPLGQRHAKRIPSQDADCDGVARTLEDFGRPIDELGEVSAERPFT